MGRRQQQLEIIGRQWHGAAVTSRLPFPLRPALLLLALPASPALADGQAWFAAETKGEIADGVLLLADANFRLMNAGSHPGQVQLRGFLGHQFGKVTLAAGYSWIWTSRPGRASRNEHRISQQMEIALIDTPGLKLASRTRLEQRFYTDAGGTSWRARQRLKLTAPLTADGFALLTHAELLAALNTGPSGAEGGDVQSRIFGGFLIPLTGSAGLEAGYLHQHDWQRAETTNHILSLNLVTKF